MCYPLLKIHIQIFSTPKELNGGEFPHNTHFLKSSIIILYSGDLILNKIHFTNKYLNYKLGYKNIGLICPTKYFHKKICCSENLTVDKIRYDITYKCTGSRNQI